MSQRPAWSTELKLHNKTLSQKKKKKTTTTTKLVYSMCMGSLTACMSVHHICAVDLEDRGGIGSPQTGVTDG